MKAFEEQLGGHHVVSENNVFLVSGATVLKPIKKKDSGYFLVFYNYIIVTQN